MTSSCAGSVPRRSSAARASALLGSLLQKELTPALAGEQRRRLERIIAELAECR